MVAVSLQEACPTLLTCLKFPCEAQQALVTFYFLCTSFLILLPEHITSSHTKLLLCLSHPSIFFPLLVQWKQKEITSQHSSSTALIAILQVHFLRNNFLNLFLFLPTVLFLVMLRAESFHTWELGWRRKLLQLLYLGEFLAQVCWLMFESTAANLAPFVPSI